MTLLNRREFLKHTTGLALACGTLSGVSGRAFAAQVTDEKLRAFLTSGERSVAGITLRHKEKLAKIYAERRFIPLWSKDGNLTRTSSAVVKKLENASLLGLHPSHYYTQVLNSWLYLQDRNSAIQLELVLTDSLYEYFDNLANGQTGEQPGDKGWFVKQSKTDVAYDAENFFRGDASFKETIDRLQPQDQRYTNLLVALNDYHQIANSGGFTPVSSGATLKPGDQDHRVQQLRTRLTQSGDINPTGSSAPDVYDWAIAEGVTLFQQRHGLIADGMLGKKTLAEINAPVEQRIAQIEVNLDRWRWLPRDLGANSIVVNTAGFEMDVNLNHSRALTMPVIVGKTENKTPIFSDVMEHIVFNPSWHVPVSITRDELLPKELANPGFLDNSNFVAVSLANKSSQPISSLSTDELYPSNFISRYRLQQLPGKTNALGEIKFMLPNKYSIYLHDTNAKSLFERTTRAFSHGCVRVERPQDLARTLLLSDGMDDYQIDAILDSSNTKTVNLRTHLPVHITYQTSWVDDFGKVQFRKDIYDHDRHAIQNYRNHRPLQTSKETQLLARLGVTTTAAFEG